MSTGNSSVAFVAKHDIPPSPPPASAVGPVKWVRENLFNGPVNSVLTVVFSVLVIWLVLSILPWFVDSSWHPAEMSLQGCRAEAEGACFAVIVERWHQFMFGFYDQTYFRPSLAFILVVIALAPVLFDKAPRQLLIVTGIAPFAGFWLIWGGTVWGPLAALAGPVVGWLIVKKCQPFIARVTGEDFAGLATLLTAVLAVIIWMLFLVAPLDGLFSAVAPIGLAEVPSNKLGGFLLSLIIGLVGIIVSLPIGIALALGRRSDLFAVKVLCVGFIEAIRAVPLITMLFVASSVLNYFLPPGTQFDLILRVCIMVVLFSSAYMAEVVRGGLAAVARGQSEAADAMGLTYWQSMRLIVLPQALKISIPNIVSTFIGLFKDTTLVVIIGLLDPLGLSGNIRADQDWNGIVWELYGFVALFFFIFCFGMGRYAQYLERKLNTDHR